MLPKFSIRVQLLFSSPPWVSYLSVLWSWGVERINVAAD